MATVSITRARILPTQSLMGKFDIIRALTPVMHLISRQHSKTKSQD